MKIINKSCQPLRPINIKNSVKKNFIIDSIIIKEPRKLDVKG